MEDHAEKTPDKGKAFTIKSEADNNDRHRLLEEDESPMMHGSVLEAETFGKHILN